MILIKSWALLCFCTPYLLMILVQNFMLIKNRIETWVWKLTEKKLLTFKVLSNLEKLPWSDMCTVNQPTTIQPPVKNISNDNNIFMHNLHNADQVLICQSVKKHSYALLPRSKLGRRETIKKKKSERRKRKTVFSSY